MGRISILGTAPGSVEILGLLHGTNGFEIAGVTDPDPASPAVQAARCLGIPTFRSLREMLIRTASEPVPPLTESLEPDTEPGSVPDSNPALPPGGAPRAPEILSGNSAHLSAIIQESVDAVFSVDPQDRIIFWNRGAELLLGYRAEEILGQHISLLIPPDRREEIRKIRALIEEHGFVRNYESERMAKDGTPIPVNITVTEVKDASGRRLSLTGIARDIREIKQLLLEREAHHRELEILHEVSRTILGSQDLKSVLDGILEQALAVGAFDLGVIHLLEAEGKLLAPVAHRGYRDRENVKRHYKSTKDPTTGRFMARAMTYKQARVEENVPACDGMRTFKREKIRSAIVVPVRNGDEVLGVVQLGSRTPRTFSPSDIRVLEALGSQLGIAVQKARLHEETLRAYGRLKATQVQMLQVERLRALGELAGGVAHDFNNLLSAILARTEILLEKCAEPDLLRHLEIVQRAALDGASAVQRVREFARVGSGEPHSVAVDLAAVIEDAVEFTRNRWHNKARRDGGVISVRNECRDLPAILGSPSQLREVFTNLILNAVDAMPEGGTITVRAEVLDGFLVVELSDTGVGMPPEVQQKIFEPFFTTKSDKGTGLGLSVVEGIVQGHRGTISVSSNEGRGTVFTIRLPVPTAAAETAAEPPGAKTDFAANILVIDDEDPVREILCELLELAGHKTVGASSGTEGIRLLQKREFDLVFTDLKMKDTSGWAVARTARKSRPGLPVVLVTAWGNEMTEPQMRRNGIAAVVAKPFRSREVIEVTSRLLQDRKKIQPVSRT